MSRNFGFKIQKLKQTDIFLFFFHKLLDYLFSIQNSTKQSRENMYSLLPYWPANRGGYRIFQGGGRMRRMRKNLGLGDNFLPPPIFF